MVLSPWPGVLCNKGPKISPAPAANSTGDHPPGRRGSAVQEDEERTQDPGQGQAAAEVVSATIISSQSHHCRDREQTCPLTAPMNKSLHPQSKGEKEMMPKPPKNLQEPAELPAVRTNNLKNNPGNVFCAVHSTRNLRTATARNRTARESRTNRQTLPGTHCCMLPVQHKPTSSLPPSPRVVKHRKQNRFGLKILTQRNNKNISAKPRACSPNMNQEQPKNTRGSRIFPCHDLVSCS